jgi:pyrroline-5-carboxylate reductase
MTTIAFIGLGNMGGPMAHTTLLPPHWKPRRPQAPP